MTKKLNDIERFEFSDILGWSVSRYDKFLVCKRQYFYKIHTDIFFRIPVLVIGFIKIHRVYSGQKRSFFSPEVLKGSKLSEPDIVSMSGEFFEPRQNAKWKATPNLYVIIAYDGEGKIFTWASRPTYGFSCSDLLDFLYAERGVVAAKA